MTMQPKKICFEISKEKSLQLFEYLKFYKNVQDLTEVLRLYFSLESSYHVSNNGVQYLYIRGTNDESPFYSHASNECFNGVILAGHSELMNFKPLCLPLRRVIPSDNHYCYHLKSSEGCYLWCIDSNVPQETLILIHLFYNPYESKWQICSNMTCDANETIYCGEKEQHSLNDLFWKEFEQKGFRFPSQKDITLTFECSPNYSRRRNKNLRVEDNSIHFFLISITESHSQCFVDLTSFIDECGFQTKISFEPKVKTLAHLKTFAIKYNSVFFKEIVMYGTKDGPIVYSLPQHALLTTVNAKNCSEGVTVESIILDLIRTSDEKTIKRIINYVENVMYVDMLLLDTLQNNCESLRKILVTALAVQSSSTALMRV
ncbi:hypothetical protein FDP41_006564 [Naegleria fowleri]|uniref:Uncharacterized protein n=1 Tax=Naegleria fowleri TaxID=5763 RepID=A0A6A5BI70_NAEFO|nr:uncharacterized protein FDP41_006564 [Naegleria fowleri]KAF0974532.1 hypothetical protein FDP41_006564 [Naegleria fowleri]